MKPGEPGKAEANPGVTAAGLSPFRAPATIRISASRPSAGGEIDLHFVNHDREEPPRKKNGDPNPGSGAKDEQPTAARPVGVDFAPPAGAQVSSIGFITPGEPEPRPVPFGQDQGRVQFDTPGFLVYGVARMRLAIPARPGPGGPGAR